MALEQNSVPVGGRGGRGFPELKNRQLKERAVAFYAKHKVTDALEKLLNELFLAAPSDVYGYMSEYFHTLSLEPVISTLVPREGLDVTGGRSIHVDLHCTVNGVDRFVYDSNVSLDMYPEEPDSLRPPSSPVGKGSAAKVGGAGGGGGTPKGAGAQKAKGNESFQGSVSDGGDSSSQLDSERLRKEVDAHMSVKKYISPILKGFSPKNQIDVDEALIQQTALEDVRIHPSSTVACSCAVAFAGAQLMKTQLFLHLSTFVPAPLLPPVITSAQQRTPKRSPRFTMPIPVVSALAGGQLLIGKLRFREFCVTPLSGSPFPEQIKMLVNVHTELGKAVQGKAGVSGQATLPNGAYCPSLDKPDQGLDLIRDACKNAGLQLNENIGIIINIGADKLFDQDKGKYELVAGQWKTTDDIINLYSDLLQSYPGLLGFIDPLHQNDINGWRTLQEKLGKKCLLIAEKVLFKGLPLKKPPSSSTCDETDAVNIEPNQANAEDGETSGGAPPQSGEGEHKKGQSALEDDEPGVEYLSCAGVQFETTVWSTMQKAAALKGNSHYLMMVLPHNLTVNTLPADLAVAMHCRFIRMGAPAGINSALLSRLLYIRDELTARKLHESAKAHVFTSSQTTDGQ